MNEPMIVPAGKKKLDLALFDEADYIEGDAFEMGGVEFNIDDDEDHDPQDPTTPEEANPSPS